MARIRRFGQEPSSVATISAQVSTKCSQLSRTRRLSRASRWATSESKSVVPGASLMPRTEATARGTSSGSESGASSTSHAPSSNSSTTLEATAMASRVLPEPPDR